MGGLIISKPALPHLNRASALAATIAASDASVTTDGHGLGGIGRPYRQPPRQRLTARDETIVDPIW
jgi:hypothetical protein